MARNNKITGIPFAKAYDFLLNKKGLTSAEKLVLIVICRFWPNPYWDSNGEVAKTLGFTERYVEKVIRSLAKKGIIKRGYAHMVKNGKPHTVRVIAPRCFPKIASHRIKWVKPEHIDGEQPELTDGYSPNNSSLLPEQMDDLLDENRQEEEITPSSLPTGGQAPAFKDKNIDQNAGRQRPTAYSWRRRGRQTPIPTQAEFEKRRQTQLKDLLGRGDSGEDSGTRNEQHRTPNYN